MEKIWNDFSIKRPPFVTLSANYNNFVLKIHAVIDTYLSRHAQYESEFNETAALLSRLMARRKNSFSKMKGFKEICKLNAALCRLLRIDFLRDLETFRNTLPDVDYEEGTKVHMPTRDSFDFLLIRMVAVYELYLRIDNCCKSAAEYFTCQIHMNFFFETNTLLLAVLAKIHSISIKLLKIASDLYNNTLTYRLKFPVNEKSKFLRETQFEFPNKLEAFNLNIREGETAALKDQPLKVLLGQEEKLATIKPQKLKKTDTGTQVKRSSKPTQQIFDIEKLNSVEEIKRFITMESKSRKTDLKNSVTVKVLSHEWAGATKLFERKINNGEVKKAINIFRKFLSLKVL